MVKTNNEEWKEIRIDPKNQRRRYAISNKGRICSFKETLEEKKILRGTNVNGYLVLKVKIVDQDYQYYVHKLVGQLFIKKTKRNQDFIIHHNFDKLNNKVSNLSWATKAEVEEHQKENPEVIAYREKIKVKGQKLSIARVRQIKKIISKESRRLLLKDVAFKFGISEMQLYRIKSGENWGHVE